MKKTNVLKFKSPAAVKTTKSTKPVKPLKPKGRAKKAWELRLYIAGQTEKSVVALENLKNICETHLKGEYFIEVVDLLKQPQLARGDQIVATPTLVKKLPTPVKRIIGDLSDTERVLVGLNLRPVR